MKNHVQRLVDQCVTTRILFVCLVASILMLVAASRVYAATVETAIVDSRLVTSFAGERISADINANQKGAQSFEMRGTPANLSSVTVIVKNYAAGDSTANIALYSSNGSQPDTLLEDLGNITITGSTEQDRIVYSGGIGYPLAANTKYWIVVTYASGDFDWMITNQSEDNYDIVADMGYDDVLWRNDTPQWSQPTLQTFKVRVVAEYSDTPSLSIVTSGFELTDEGAPGGISFYPFFAVRNGYDLGSVSVDYAVTGTGTYPDVPASAADFYQGNFPTGTVTFADRETSKRIDISYHGDHMVESDETYTLTLSNPSGGATIGTASIDGTIPNDDTATYTLTSNGNVTEGDSGVTMAYFTIQIDEVLAIPSYTPTFDNDFDFEIYTMDDTAQDEYGDGDYTSLLGEPVTLTAGQTSVSFSVDVNGDTNVESNETFGVEAGHYGEYYEVLSSENMMVYCTILNDDVPPPPPGTLILDTGSMNPDQFSMSWDPGTNTFRLESATQLFPTSDWQEVTGLTNTTITVLKEHVIGTNLYYRVILNP